MQAIRVQLAPGHVITATLLEFESEMTTQNARITAMHQYNPYRFMCNEKGIMVHANKLAWEAYSTGKRIQVSVVYLSHSGDLKCADYMLCMPHRHRCSTYPDGSLCSRRVSRLA